MRIPKPYALLAQSCVDCFGGGTELGADDSERIAPHVEQHRLLDLTRRQTLLTARDLMPLQDRAHCVVVDFVVPRQVVHLRARLVATHHLALLFGRQPSLRLPHHPTEFGQHQTRVDVATPVELEQVA